jgi:hypothetical protein
MNNTINDPIGDRIGTEVAADLARLERRLVKLEERRQKMLDLKPGPGEQPATAEERKAPVDTSMFLNPNERSQEVSWQNSLFGKVTIGLKDFVCGQKIQRDPYTMVVPINFCGQRPDSVTFTVKAELEKGIRLYRSQMSAVTDVTEGQQADATFPITWKNIGKGLTAAQTVKGKRDMDLVFLDVGGVVDGRKGAFLVLEVGIANRGTTLFLCFQSKVYAGQVVTTTLMNAQAFELTPVKTEGRVVSVVPLMPECAAPGTNFFKNFEHLASSFMQEAVRQGAWVQLYRCVVPKWTPERKALTDDLIKDGWSGANVGWFNNVTGYGFLVDDDGKSVFAHFYNIEGPEGPVWKKQFPSLPPFARVAIKPGLDRENNLITRIRVL